MFGVHKPPVPVDQGLVGGRYCLSIVIRAKHIAKSIIANINTPILYIYIYLEPETTTFFWSFEKDHFFCRFKKIRSFHLTVIFCMKNTVVSSCIICMCIYEFHQIVFF